MSNRSAKCENSSDLPILRASAITSPSTDARERLAQRQFCARSNCRGKSVKNALMLARASMRVNERRARIQRFRPELLNFLQHVKHDDRDVSQSAARARLRNCDQ